LGAAASLLVGAHGGGVQKLLFVVGVLGQFGKLQCPIKGAHAPNHSAQDRKCRGKSSSTRFLVGPVATLGTRARFAKYREATKSDLKFAHLFNQIMGIIGAQA
jgi:hypothetical protein